MIPPIPPNLAAAGIKSAGSVTSAAIGRYRPAGVPRTGSTEDRAAAYERLLNAATAAQSTLYLFRRIPKDTSDQRAEEAPLLLRALARQMGKRDGADALVPHLGRILDSGHELIAALGAVRLRGTIAVIAAAENLVNAVSDVETSASDDDFDTAFRATVTTYNAFLDAARADLGYDTKPYQVLRRRREKKFLRRQAAAAAIEA